MGNQLPISFHSLLWCLLENLKSLHLVPNLKSPKILHLCNKVWPQYPLDSRYNWLLTDTLGPSIIWYIYNYCEWSSKWEVTLHANDFSYLHYKPSFCAACFPTQFLLAIKSEKDESINYDPANKPNLIDNAYSSCFSDAWSFSSLLLRDRTNFSGTHSQSTNSP